MVYAQRKQSQISAASWRLPHSIASPEIGLATGAKQLQSSDALQSAGDNSPGLPHQATQEMAGQTRAASAISHSFRFSYQRSGGNSRSQKRVPSPRRNQLSRIPASCPQNALEFRGSSYKTSLRSRSPNSG